MNVCMYVCIYLLMPADLDAAADWLLSAAGCVDDPPPSGTPSGTPSGLISPYETASNAARGPSHSHSHSQGHEDADEDVPELIYDVSGDPASVRRPDDCGAAGHVAGHVGVGVRLCERGDEQNAGQFTCTSDDVRGPYTHTHRRKLGDLDAVD
jgi:hypothetical protein